jgi:hypothetical protein
MTTVTHGVHLLRWGGRLRDVDLRDQNTTNYTGTFMFSSLDSYRITLMGQRAGWSGAADPGGRRCRRPVLITAGNPLASLNGMARRGVLDGISAGWFAAPIRHLHGCFHP